ncbi:MAG: hypothetical protein ACRDLB_03160 [Actinomycetota bacterium]
MASNIGGPTQLRYSRLVVRVVAAATVLVGLGLLGQSARMSPGAWTVLLSTLASIAISLGVAGLLYDFFLRESVLAETLEIVQVRENIAAVGLKQVTDPSEIEFNVILRNGHRFDLLLADPFAWVTTHWNAILDAGRSREILVDVSLPD